MTSNQSIISLFLSFLYSTYYKQNICERTVKQKPQEGKKIWEVFGEECNAIKAKKALYEGIGIFTIISNPDVGIEGDREEKYRNTWEKMFEKQVSSLKFRDLVMDMELRCEFNANILDRVNYNALTCLDVWKWFKVDLKGFYWEEKQRERERERERGRERERERGSICIIEIYYDENGLYFSLSKILLIL